MSSSTRISFSGNNPMQFWIAAGAGISCYAITATLLQMARICHFLVAGQSYAIPGNIFIMGDAALANVLVATLLAPLLEELVFRKWLISGLLKLRLGAVLALSLSSAIFVLAHNNLPTPPRSMPGCCY
jgi:membrane protease YdiL (CAAX protease family)